jgi:prepilin-type N-terminal cleavage/methylation domain-containing protein
MTFFVSKSETSNRNRNCRGFSLLEVLLSIAILGGAMVVIGQLVNIGYRSAIEARIRSDANILVDGKMAEVSAGIIELQSVSSSVIEENPDWMYSVDVQQAGQLGLLMVMVTVEQTPNSASNPISMSVVRLMPDPEYDPLDYIDEE